MKLRTRPEWNPKNNIVVKFFLLNTSLAIALSFQGVYISTLLQRSSGREDIVLLFNGINFVLVALSMTAGSILLQKFSVGFLLKAGIFSHLLVYVVTIAMAHNLAAVLPLVSFFNSLGAGLYAVAYNVLLTRLTRESNRDAVLGLFGVGGSVVGLSVPLLMGFVISGIGGLKGYYVVMAASLGLGILILLFGSTKGFPEAKSVVAYKNPFSVLKIMGKTTYGKNTLILAFVRCVRESSVPVLLSLLLFTISKNEAIIGINSTLGGIMAVLASALYSRWMRPTRRRKSVLISTLVVVIISIPMIFVSSVWMLLLVSAVNGFMGVFMGTPGVSVEMAGLEQLWREEGVELSHSFAAREYVVMAGRLTGMVVLAVFNGNYRNSVLAIIVLVLSQLVLVAFVQPKKQEEESE